MSREFVENRVVVLGKAGVGKSTLLKRYVEGEFNPKRVPTVAAAHREKKSSDGQQLLSFFDTAGDDLYRNFMRMYYKQASVALVLYDVTDENSFDAVEHYIEELKWNDFDDDHIIIVGTKTDLSDFRTVSQARLKEKAEQLGVHFFECSSKDESNVEQLFKHVSSLVHGRYEEKVEQEAKTKEQPLDTINAIYKFIEDEIKNHTKKDNPWNVRYFKSRSLKTDQGTRARVPTNIKRIHDLCKKGRKSGSIKVHELCLKSIAHIVADKELKDYKKQKKFPVKNTFWARLVRRIRNFLIRKGWIIDQTTRNLAYGPIYELLADNNFLAEKQIMPKDLHEKVKVEREFINDEAAKWKNAKTKAQDSSKVVLSSFSESAKSDTASVSEGDSVFYDSSFT